jgi:hypothetical protein
MEGAGGDAVRIPAHSRPTSSPPLTVSSPATARRPGGSVSLVDAGCASPPFHRRQRRPTRARPHSRPRAAAPSARRARTASGGPLVCARGRSASRPGRRAWRATVLVDEVTGWACAAGLVVAGERGEGSARRDDAVTASIDAASQMRNSTYQARVRAESHQIWVGSRTSRPDAAVDEQLELLPQGERGRKPSSGKASRPSCGWRGRWAPEGEVAERELRQERPRRSGTRSPYQASRGRHGRGPEGQPSATPPVLHELR